MAYAPTVWIDDDGSNQVGTEFTAARMNKIEQGIANAGTGGGGGGAGVAPVYAQCGGGPYAPVAPLAWAVVPIPAPPTLVASKADGLSDDFTRNADGSLTVKFGGNYSFDLSLVASAALPDNTNINARLTKKAGALPAVGDGLTGFNVTTGTHANNYATATLSRTALCAAGDRIAIYLYTSANVQWAVQDFSVALEGGLKGDKGDTGGNATVPIDPWHNVGGVGEPALLTPWTQVPGATLRFRKDPLGRVWIEGQITGGTSQAAFTLPVGYRPTRYEVHDNLQTNGIGGTYVIVDVNGIVSPAISNAGYACYIDVNFDTGLVTAMPTGPKGDKGDTGGNATVPMDPWHIVGAVGEPAFTNGWVAHTGGTPPRFRKLPDGTVELAGLVKNGAVGTIAFTLPAGYRPHPTYGNVEFAVESAGLFGAVYATPAGAVVPFVGSATYFSLDGIAFDTGTVTQIPTGPQGVKGDKGDPGNMATVPMNSWHTVGTAGEPAFQNSWVLYDALTPVRFFKDPLGKVRLTGAVKSGVVGGPIFTLPAGFRPAKPQLNFPVDANGAFGNIVLPDDGRVILNVGSNGYVFLDAIEFDTETVTAMPTGPKGDKGDPGTGVFKTLNWNTALAPGFYYGGGFGLEGNTSNGPGDPLNNSDQAGIVSINANKVVQRVWDLDTQRAYTRFRLYDLTWTPWVLDVLKPGIFPEPMVGGITPEDGEERLIQTADMATRGEIWKMRYRKLSPLGSKWEFVGGSHVVKAAAGLNANAGASTTDAALSVTMAFGGIYDVEWGARMYMNPANPAGAGNVILYADQIRAGNTIVTANVDLWANGINGQTWSTVVSMWKSTRFTVQAGDIIRLRTVAAAYNAAVESPVLKVKPVCVTM